MSNTSAHTLTRLTDRDRRTRILRAIVGYKPGKDPLGASLKTAIRRYDAETSFDGLDGLPEGIFATPDGGFEAVGSLYLKFPDGNPAESARAIIKGRFKGEEVVIDAIIPRMPNP